MKSDVRRLTQSQTSVESFFFLEGVRRTKRSAAKFPRQRNYTALKGVNHSSVEIISKNAKVIPTIEVAGSAAFSDIDRYT